MSADSGGTVCGNLNFLIYERRLITHHVRMREHHFLTKMAARSAPGLAVIIPSQNTVEIHCLGPNNNNYYYYKPTFKCRVLAESPVIANVIYK